ncbi:MAG: SDR family oxidoreductase [Acidimicrobiia bacterium]|nr:SDR family oxidoreductase [Acidimicrobiia bacterium]
MDTRVDGKVALVTGASRGIGEAVAEGFLASGARGVVITGRKQENLDGAVRRLGAGDRLLAIAGRADSEEDADRVVRATIEHFGSCDILVNNAGTNAAPGNLVDVDLSAVDKTWSVNQRGPLVMTQAVWRNAMKVTGGVICNTASVGGLKPGPFIGAYNVSKAALIFMTKQLAMELAPTVRVNAVAPAVVKTRLSEILWKADEAAAAAAHPLNMLGEPQDVANAIVFLCSDQARWITGVTLPVDGGVANASSDVLPV